jgi:flagellar hook assembly protein FlgD
MDDILRIRFTVSKAATLALNVETEAGVPVGSIVSARPLAKGTSTVQWRGTFSGSPVPDGHYRLVAVATAGAEQVTRRAPLTIDRTLGGLTVTPGLFSPNGDGRRETVAIGFTLAHTATVRLRILRGTKRVATLLKGTASSGLHTMTWDGKNAADGTLRVVAEATTSLGTRSLERALVRDTRKPRATILEARKRTGGGVFVRIRLDEPALLVLRFDGETVKRQSGIGVLTFRRTLASTKVSVYAQDAAGNGRTTFARAR